MMNKIKELSNKNLTKAIENWEQKLEIAETVRKEFLEPNQKQNVLETLSILYAEQRRRNETKYVLVKIDGNNHQIGRVEYENEKSAVSRQNELLKMGIELNVMTFEQAYGI